MANDQNEVKSARVVVDAYMELLTFSSDNPDVGDYEGDGNV